MAKLPTHASSASVAVCALIGAVLAGPAPIADASAPAHAASFHDVNEPDQDPAPLIPDPPEVQTPSNPGQKTLAPPHHRSHHRTPTHT